MFTAFIIVVYVNLVHENGENSNLCIFVISWLIHTFLAYVDLYTWTGDIGKKSVYWWRITNEWNMKKLNFRILQWQRIFQHKAAMFTVASIWCVRMAKILFAMPSSFLGQVIIPSLHMLHVSTGDFWIMLVYWWFMPKLNFRFLQWQCALLSAHSGDVHGCVNLVHEDGENTFAGCVFVISWPIHNFLAYVTYINRRYLDFVDLLVMDKKWMKYGKASLNFGIFVYAYYPYCFTILRCLS